MSTLLKVSAVNTVYNVKGTFVETSGSGKNTVIIHDIYRFDLRKLLANGLGYMELYNDSGVVVSKKVLDNDGTNIQVRLTSKEDVDEAIVTQSDAHIDYIVGPTNFGVGSKIRYAFGGSTEEGGNLVIEASKQGPLIGNPPLELIYEGAGRLVIDVPFEVLP